MADTDTEEFEKQFEEQLKSLRIQDVLVQSLVTVSAIGFRRLGLTDDSREERDLAQSQLAIEAMEALAPVLEGFLPSQLSSDFKGSVSQLKIAYGRAVADRGSSGDATGQTPAPPTESAESAQADEPTEGADADESTDSEKPEEPKESADGADSDGAAESDDAAEDSSSA
jgi:hypothetical protein